MEKVFERRSVIPTTVEHMWAFHEDKRALARLTPPPLWVRRVRDEMRSLTDGELEFQLWLGPLPVRWVARHEPGPLDTSFADRMLAGPLASWRHEHIFRAVPGGVELTDRVTYAHKPGLAGLWTRLLFDGLPLKFLFFYRHLRTRLALGGKR
ncbi:MAG: SRPBCC family protein [Chloroflexi bacterium]|nr:SRPBCC family protein [Chloroflexota bacterium]